MTEELFVNIRSFILTVSSHAHPLCVTALLKQRFIVLQCEDQSRFVAWFPEVPKFQLSDGVHRQYLSRPQKRHTMDRAAVCVVCEKISFIFYYTPHYIIHITYLSIVLYHVYIYVHVHKSPS